MATDFENDLLLVTAASGKQASHLLPHLVKKWKRLRLQCVSDASRTRLEQEYPNAEVVQSSFGDMESAKRLMDGVSACYLVLPGFHPREAQCGLNILDAATEQNRSGNRVSHIVLSSVIHSLLRALANHDSKRFVEEALIESDLPYTIIQPTHLMDTVPVRKIVEANQPVFSARFDLQTKFSFLSCHDLGEAVANILANREEYLYGSYQLVSTPTPLNYTQAMDIVSDVIGRKVKIERVPVEEAARAFKEMTPQSTPEDDRLAIERNVARMLVYYNSKGLVGNSKQLEMILGRRPLGYREWLEMKLEYNNNADKHT